MSEQTVKTTEQTGRVKRQSMFMITMRRMAKNKLAVAGLVILLLMMLALPIGIYGSAENTKAWQADLTQLLNEKE